MSVRLNARKVGDITILEAEGTITAGNDATQFGDMIRQLATDGHKKVLVSLAQISYIDSCGIGEMVSGFTLLSRNGGALKLISVTKRIQDLMVMTGLHKVIEVHADETAGSASFGAPGE